MIITAALLLCACTLAPGTPLVSIAWTYGGVISVPDHTEIYPDGRVSMGRRRATLSPRAMRELREVVESHELTALAESLAPLAAKCGVMEENTIAIRYGGSLGLCVNERDVPNDLLKVIDRIEAPLIRELGGSYSTRAGARLRGDGL